MKAKVKASTEREMLVGVVEKHMGVVTKGEDRPTFFAFFTYSGHFYLAETIMGKNYHVRK